MLTSYEEYIGGIPTEKVQEYWSCQVKHQQKGQDTRMGGTAGSKGRSRLWRVGAGRSEG